MRIRITKKDIEEGIPGNVSMCPVALCLRRKLRSNKIRVDVDSVDIGEERIELPISATRFIFKYDRAKDKNKMKSVTFNINIAKNQIK